jgi:hypothetical protein
VLGKSGACRGTGRGGRGAGETVGDKAGTLGDDAGCVSTPGLEMMQGASALRAMALGLWQGGISASCWMAESWVSPSLAKGTEDAGC